MDGRLGRERRFRRCGFVAAARSDADVGGRIIVRTIIHADIIAVTTSVIASGWSERVDAEGCEALKIVDEATISNLRFGKRECKGNTNWFGGFSANRLVDRPVRPLTRHVAISVEIIQKTL